jgi:hypothetical protein
MVGFYPKTNGLPNTSSNLTEKVSQKQNDCDDTEITRRRRPLVLRSIQDSTLRDQQKSASKRDRQTAQSSSKQ